METNLLKSLLVVFKPGVEHCGAHGSCEGRAQVVRRPDELVESLNGADEPLHGVVGFQSDGEHHPETPPLLMELAAHGHHVSGERPDGNSQRVR